VNVKNVLLYRALEAHPVIIKKHFLLYKALEAHPVNANNNEDFLLYEALEAHPVNANNNENFPALRSARGTSCKCK
jgi:hypothetical protein